MKKLLIGTAIAGVLALALLVGVVGFGVVSTAFAQGPNGFPGYAACHNSSEVLQLLGMNQQELLTQRQANKSLLEIAQAKEVSEAKLTDALMQPVASMHTWMGQTYGNQSYVDQMTQAMRDWIAKDIREPKLGTMTDARLGLVSNGAGYGMMNGFYGYGTTGGQFTAPNGWGGMMGGQYSGPNRWGGMTLAPRASAGVGGWRR